MRKDTTTLLTIDAVNLSPILPAKRSLASYQGNCTGEKEMIRHIGDYWTVNSELTLIPGDPKCHYGPPVKVGAYGDQVEF